MIETLTREKKLELYELLLQKRARTLQGSFHEFVKECFEYFYPKEPFLDNWHIRYICTVLQREAIRIKNREPKTKDLIINIPPRSLKSFVVTVCYPAWCWTIEPTLKFIGSSHSDDLATEHNVMTRRIIESPWYKQMFPFIRLVDDQNTKTKFENTQMGSRRSTSTRGTIIGKGADIIMIDDPQNPEKAASENEREAVQQQYDQELSTRLNHPDIGLFIIIMQRLHDQDLTGYLLKKDPQGYFHICIPAEVSNNIFPPLLKQFYIQGLFFPERFTFATLQRMKTKLGSFGYAGQFGQRPTPEGGGTLKKKWFKIITWNEFNHIVESHKKGFEPVWNFKVDTAYTKDQENDPSAVLSFCWIGGNIYIRNSWADQLEFPELIKELPNVVNANGYTNKSRVGVEPKASGKSVVQTLKRFSDLNIVEDKPPTDDKKTRVEGISPFVESGKCFLIEGHWNDEFIEECAAFPKGSHDDRLDTLVMAITNKPKRLGT